MSEIEVWKLKTKIYSSMLLFILITTLLGSLTGTMETAIIYSTGMSLFVCILGILTYFSYRNYNRLLKNEE